MDNSDVLYGNTRLIEQLPLSCHGSILLTTRDKRIGLKFAGVSRTIPVEALSKSDSSALILHRLESLLDVTANSHDLNCLTTILENIPLALVQASAFIIMCGTTVKEYLQLYSESDSSKIGLLSENFEDKVRDLNLFITFLLRVNEPLIHKSLSYTVTHLSL